MRKEPCSKESYYLSLQQQAMNNRTGLWSCMSEKGGGGRVIVTVHYDTAEMTDIIWMTNMLSSRIKETKGKQLEIPKSNIKIYGFCIAISVALFNNSSVNKARIGQKPKKLIRFMDLEITR